MRQILIRQNAATGSEELQKFAAADYTWTLSLPGFLPLHIHASAFPYGRCSSPRAGKGTLARACLLSGCRHIGCIQPSVTTTSNTPRNTFPYSGHFLHFEGKKNGLRYSFCTSEDAPGNTAALTQYQTGPRVISAPFPHGKPFQSTVPFTTLLHHSFCTETMSLFPNC